MSARCSYWTLRIDPEIKKKTREMINQRKIEAFDSNDEKNNNSSGLFENLKVNKKVKSKEFLQNKRVFAEMRQSLTNIREKEKNFREMRMGNERKLDAIH